ncbi:MAG: C-GCAxxG-C-C family protein [Candidatus Scalindua sp.]
MENKEVGDLARDYYLKGFGCAESILHAFNDLGITDVPETLLKASTGFGTGFGGRGSTCGAITGPIMAVGLKYGRLKPEESTDNAYKLTKKIVDAYEQKYKTTECAHVTRVWREREKFDTPERRKFCGAIVRYMAREAEKILDEEDNK